MQEFSNTVLVVTYFGSETVTFLCMSVSRLRHYTWSTVCPSIGSTAQYLCGKFLETSVKEIWCKKQAKKLTQSPAIEHDGLHTRPACRNGLLGRARSLSLFRLAVSFLFS